MSLSSKFSSTRKKIKVKAIVLLFFLSCVTAALFNNCAKSGFEPKTLTASLSSTNQSGDGSSLPIPPTTATPAPGPGPVATATPAPTAAPTPANGLITDRIFAPTSFWYTPIPENAPLHPNSKQMVQDFLAQKSAYYGNVTINTRDYASPVYISEANTPKIKVSFNDCQNKGYADPGLLEQWSAVPIPTYAVPALGTDSEMTIYQPSTDTIWEFWVTNKNGGNFSACWGGRLQNASKSQGAFPGSYGTTATSLAFLGGQITPDELKRGEIRHALGIALVDLAAYNVFSWPAQRSDGNGQGLIPEGLRFRLDPSVNVDALNMTNAGKTIAKAAQKYGFIVWDKAGSISLRAENPLSYTQMGKPDPYPALFQGKQNYQVLDGFPWNRLQFMPMNYGKP